MAMGRLVERKSCYAILGVFLYDTVGKPLEYYFSYNPCKRVLSALARRTVPLPWDSLYGSQILPRLANAGLKGVTVDLTVVAVGLAKLLTKG